MPGKFDPAPKDTPANICSRLTQYTQAILEDPGFVQRLRKNGGEPLKGNAEQTTAKMIAEEALWRSVPTEALTQSK